ncbi:hypothetical protein AZE42_02540 [Rhizopogon vesiculosus]|uniref:Hydrophobin n=1 Tax=Rhizopogon vesiculosus TaxID=180088 RepID=A0A1J8RBK8_9AGAM|nr:hypothetical protein AZE42_02540 [Rhizopogon vesiculosus]
MYFYGTVLTLAALTAGVSALPPRSITARNTSNDVTAVQDGQASGESINGGNCLSLGCLSTLIETGTDYAEAGGLESLGSLQSNAIESNIAGAGGLGSLDSSLAKAIETNNAGAGGLGSLGSSLSEAIESNIARAGGLGSLGAIPQVGKSVSAKFGSTGRPSAGDVYSAVGGSAPGGSINDLNSSLIELDTSKLCILWGLTGRERVETCFERRGGQRSAHILDSHPRS